MLPRNFDYYAPASLKEAVAVLKKHSDARILAGGQSLLPMMKLRLASPEAIVDISRIKELRGIRQDKDKVLLGAMTTISEIAISEVVKSELPALFEAASAIADPQVRNMGTIGGNIANADPGNDMPAIAIAYGAGIEIFDGKITRNESADTFFVDAYTTKAAQHEIITSLVFPKGMRGSAYARVNRRIGDYALASACAVIEVSGGRITEARIAFNGAAQKAIRAEASERRLVDSKPSTDAFDKAAQDALKGLEIEDSFYASASVKKAAIRHVVAEAVENAYRRAKVVR
ncbi:MAG: xanthine dehydrogenase family protein subunit M [Candidatus Micrarchaeales archaeon]|nr:xanthine dehydrogenase family protein subunit M [Candidatus Micrarchaeales archaeon]